ncbi:MAG: FKBP-type peptidyl-prolyl cis-trans isomerase [Bacteroidales bacterium]|nr:FKBP-type peptidyl-prolyl cis-trans isomerase [Bacteroidales bacterium]
MKANKFFAVLLIGLAAAACRPASDLPKEYQPSAALRDSVSYLIGINFGTFLTNYDFGKDINYAEIVKGMKDFVNAEGDFQDPEFVKQFRVDPNLINDMFNNYLENRRTGLAQAAKEKSEKFLADNKKKDGIFETPSGLQYRIVDPGSGEKPGPQDTVWVRYKGSLIDGTVFDEVPADAEPIRLMLNRVVPGWTEGLQLIGEGGKIDLFIPSDLGYGEQGNQGIPGNSALIFNVEMTKVAPYIESVPTD